MPRYPRSTPAFGALCLFAIAALGRAVFAADAPAAAAGEAKTTATAIATAAPAGPVQDFAAYAPADAYYFVGVGNMKALREAWPKTAPARLLADPQVAAATAGLNKDIWEGVDETLKEAGLKREDIETLLPGQAAFWSESLEPYKPNEYGYAFVADRSAPAAKYTELIDKLVAKGVEVPVQSSREMVNGLEVFAKRWDLASTLDAEEKASPMAKFTKHSLIYAFPEGKIFIAWDGDESIERMRRRKDSGEGSLGALAAFQPMTKGFAPAQVRLFWSVGVWARSMSNALKYFNPTEPPTFDFEKLGLYDFKAVAYEFRLGAEAIEFSSRFIHEPNPRGAAKAFFSEVPLDPQILRAAPEKPQGVEAMGFDIGAAAAEAIKAAQASSPQNAAMLGIMLSQVQMQTGVPLVEEMLPALGDQLASMQVATPGKPSESERVFVVALKSSAPFVKAIETLQKMPSPSFEVGEPFLGAKIYNFKGMQYGDETIAYRPQSDAAPMQDDGSGEEPGDAMPPGKMVTVATLALADSYAVYSASGDLVRETLRRLAGKDPKNYYDAKQFKQPAPVADGKLCAYSQSDLSVLARMLVELVDERSRWEELMEKQGEMAPRKPLVPDQAVFERYLGLCEGDTWIMPDGLYGRGRLPNTPGAK